jgi:hypothetical protein
MEFLLSRCMTRNEARCSDNVLIPAQEIARRLRFLSIMSKCLAPLVNTAQSSSLRDKSRKTLEHDASLAWRAGHTSDSDHFRIEKCLLAVLMRGVPCNIGAKRIHSRTLQSPATALAKDTYEAEQAHVASAELEDVNTNELFDTDVEPGFHESYINHPDEFSLRTIDDDADPEFSSIDSDVSLSSITAPEFHMQSRFLDFHCERYRLHEAVIGSNLEHLVLQDDEVQIDEVQMEEYGLDIELDHDLLVDSSLDFLTQDDMAGDGKEDEMSCWNVPERKYGFGEKDRWLCGDATGGQEPDTVEVIDGLQYQKVCEVEASWNMSIADILHTAQEDDWFEGWRETT